MSSAASYLPLLQRYLTRYGMTTYNVLGNIGLVFNMMLFLWPVFRRNPCSIYIFAASLTGLIGLNISTIPVIHALDHPNPSTVSVRFCELQFYFRHSFNQMMRTYFICACIDRYAISSGNKRIRSFSRFRIAVYIIISVPIFWFLLALWPNTLNTLENGRCGGKKGLSAIILSIYMTLVVGIIPLLGMIIFGLLMLKNLRNVRSRVQPNSTVGVSAPRIHKRDRDMTKMLLIEIVGYIITISPFAINLLYQSATQTITKSVDQQLIESFSTYFNGTFLIYMNNSFSFWIYICVSRTFRSEVKNLCLKCCKMISNQSTQWNTSVT
ncbi:unnamed protein product [Adineta ricciae]|uniref:G-protein coupled receptors family 1 profile domain-containing protein n=1 Tax=Adineta ricciae TaxID=249248 RepID=A0A814YF01_ADIRI|nr:unnamed protein product [Adineta ricciae]CAF1608958.1 unnamed protein product [Adineta ricciae]